MPQGKKRPEKAPGGSGKRPRRGLTARQLAFAKAITDGCSPSEAYRRCYDSRSNPRVIAVHAQRVLAHPLVDAKIAELRARTETRDTLSRQQKRELLAAMVLEAVPFETSGGLDAAVIEDFEEVASEAGLNHDQVTRLVRFLRGNAPDSPGPKRQLTREQLEAIKIDNVMGGHNEPEKIHVEGVDDLVDLIRSTAPKL